ncbi:hypothetical protein COK81_23685, partial [Bacillus thuringiensis]
MYLKIQNNRSIKTNRYMFAIIFYKLWSGAKNRNALKVFFQTRLYWYYYLKKVCDQHGTRKYI